jgi:hypothetical protein
VEDRVRRSREHREGPLNWPQQEWLSGYTPGSDSEYVNNQAVWFDFRERIPIAQALKILAGTVNRHDSLRTVFPMGEAGIEGQTVAPMLDEARAVEAHTSLVEFSSFQCELAEMRRRSFRITEEWPFQAVLGCEAGMATSIGVVMDHSACDAWGKWAFERQVRLLESDDLGLWPSRREQDSILQPLGLATWEGSADGVEHLGRSVDFWKRQFREASVALGPSAIANAAPVEAPGANATYRSHRMEASALVAEAKSVSKKRRVPVSTTFLQAFGSALSEANDCAGIGMFMLSANRPTLPRQRTVSKMFATAPLVVRRIGADDLDGLLRATLHQQIELQRYGSCEQRTVDDLVAKHLPNAVSLDVMGSYFNFVDDSTSGSPITVIESNRSREATEDAPAIEVSPPLPTGAPLMFHVRVSDTFAFAELTCLTGSKWDRIAGALLRSISASIMSMT